MAAYHRNDAPFFSATPYSPLFWANPCGLHFACPRISIIIYTSYSLISTHPGDIFVRGNPGVCPSIARLSTLRFCARQRSSPTGASRCIDPLMDHWSSRHRLKSIWGYHLKDRSRTTFRYIKLLFHIEQNNHLARQNSVNLPMNESQ